MSETPRATAKAFAELAEVMAGRASPIDVPSVDGSRPDAEFAALLSAIDEEAAHALGAKRAETSLPNPSEFGGDALAMLRDAASCFYDGRTNYGAASVEITPQKAIVRFVVSEDFAKSSGGMGEVVVRGFLERAVELVTGEHMLARFAGNTPRVDGRFDRPMYNMVFEFEFEA